VKVEKFKSIFEGLDVAYGQHQPQGSRADGKQQGKSYMVRKEVTHELWEKHLEGEGPSLGIIPIRADNTTKWGCIDVDIYPLDHRALIIKIRKLGLPLVYCKSKSGGAHLFLFMKNSVASKLVRTKLTDMASSLGQSESEIFPKQSGIQPEKGDLGNFLNLPYFHSDKSVRYAIKDNATAATLEEFFEMHEKYSVDDIDSIGTIKSEAIIDGPPCLQSLCSQGFPEGGRNNGLFSLGVYLKKFDEQHWEEQLVKYNLQYMKPPLVHTEVTTLIKTLNKKDYQYKCKDQPISSFCNVNICKTRKHGVGASNVSQQLGALSKLCTEPPIWFLEIPSDDPTSDLKLQLTTEELQIQTKFQKRCMEVINIMPPLMKPSDWQQLVNSKMLTALLIEVSNDGSVSGQFIAHLQEFCTDRAQAQNRDDILLRKPWTESNMEEVGGKSEDVRRTYFRLKDLHAYLLRQKFTHYTNTGQIIAELRKINGLHKFMRLKKQGVNTWGIPAFNSIDSEHAIQEQDEVPF
tara:strand:- start:4478 stop:6028 length:1551 start_codon:yes stop_codon:yes gene_type:complete